MNNFVDYLPILWVCSSINGFMQIIQNSFTALFLKYLLSTLWNPESGSHKYTSTWTELSWNTFIFFRKGTVLSVESLLLTHGEISSEVNVPEVMCPAIADVVSESPAFHSIDFFHVADCSPLKVPARGLKLTQIQILDSGIQSGSYSAQPHLTFPHRDGS